MSVGDQVREYELQGGWVLADSHGLYQIVGRSLLVKHLPHYCFGARDGKLLDDISCQLLLRRDTACFMCDLSNFELTSLFCASAIAFFLALIINLV